MKKYFSVFRMFFLLSSFLFGQNLYFDYPHDGDKIYSEINGSANLCFRILDPSFYYYDIADFEVRLHYPNGITTDWVKLGKSGCFELIIAGNYWIQARVKVKHDLGGQGNYYLYSYAIDVSMLDLTPTDIPANFQVIDNLNENPILSWNSNQEKDIDSYLVNKEVTISGEKESTSFYTKSSQFLDSNFLSNYKSGIDKVEYWIQAKDINNNLSGETIHHEITGTSLIQMKIAQNTFPNEDKLEFGLLQNYPNPFNPSTNINFRLLNNGFTRIDVYNYIGEKVENLLAKDLTAGDHSIKFNGDKLPSGIYIVMLGQNKNFSSKKIQLIK